MNIRNETDLIEDTLQWLNKGQKLVVDPNACKYNCFTVPSTLCLYYLCVGLVSSVYVLVCLLIPIIGPTNIDINCDM